MHELGVVFHIADTLARIAEVTVYVTLVLPSTRKAA